MESLLRPLQLLESETLNRNTWDNMITYNGLWQFSAFVKLYGWTKQQHIITKHGSKLSSLQSLEKIILYLAPLGWPQEDLVQSEIYFFLSDLVYFAYDKSLRIFLFAPRTVHDSVNIFEFLSYLSSINCFSPSGIST